MVLCSMQRRCLLLLIVLAALTLVQADHYHHGHISWKICEDLFDPNDLGTLLEPGFHDDAFPDVCKVQRQPLSNQRFVGFTLHTAFNSMHSDSSLVDSLSYQNFLTSYNSGLCVLGLNCTIEIIRAPPAGGGTSTDLQALVTRRIGFKTGFQASAVIDRDVEIADAGKDAQGINDMVTAAKYVFVVDRVSYDVNQADPEKYQSPTIPYDAAGNMILQGVDPRYIYAHFSFMKELDFDQDYTVYFEGCCRPRQERPDDYKSTFLSGTWIRPAARTTNVGSDESPYDPSSNEATDMEGVFKAVCNSAGKFCMSNRVDSAADPPNVPFFVYSELQVKPTSDYLPAAALRYPRSSFKFESSNIIRMNTYGLPRCHGRTSNNFAIHGYHPNAEYSNSIFYELGDDLSRGLCLDEIRTGGRSFRCQPGVGDPTVGYGGLLRADIIQDDGIDTSDGLGVVTVSNRIPGNFMVNVVVGTNVGSGSQQVTWRSNMDFLLQVMEEVQQSSLIINDPPAPFYEDLVTEQMPSYSTPITMQCGTSTFRIGSTHREYLQFQYQDLDTFDFECDLNFPQLQTVELIGRSNNLPRGARVSSEGMINSDAAFKYVNVTWRPACEKRSDLGLFKFCFGARDSADRPEFLVNDLPSLRSTIMDSAFSLQTVPTWSPDGATSRWTKASECASLQGQGRENEYSCRNNPSCLFVNVEGFPPNPKPQLLVTRNSVPFNPPLFEACNDVPRNGDCGVGAADNLPICLARDFCQGRTQQIAQGNELQISIFGISENSIFDLSISITVEEYKCADQNTNQPPDITHLYEVSDTRYGCNGDYDSASCSSVPTSANRHDVARRLRVIAPNEFQANSDGSIDKRELLICAQVNQSVPSNINRPEWQELYGTSPNHDTCKSCFMLDLVPGSTIAIDDEEGREVTDQEGQLTPYVAFVGIEKSIELRTKGRLPNLDIMILADPGAPAHSSLLAYDEKDNGPDADGFYSSIRKFVFKPEVGQEGTTFLVKFVSRNEATNSTGLFSNSLDIEITVMVFQADWAFTEPCMPVPPDYPADTRTSGECLTAGELQATVGCTQSHRLQIELEPADLPGGQLELHGESIEAAKFLHRDAFYVQELPSCTGEFCPEEISVTMCDETSTGSCCGNGICDGVEMGSSCPLDCVHDDLTLVVQPAQDNQASAQLTFLPNQHQLGRTLLLCIGLRMNETFGGDAVLVQQRTEAKSPSLCIKMVVAACKYCVPHGKTLSFVARYFLNLDWLRLYNSNPAITNPDGLIKERELYLGPLYTVEGGDTIISIAAQMRTTVKALVENNPWLPVNQELNPGDKICVLVCSNVF